MKYKLWNWLQNWLQHQEQNQEQNSNSKRNNNHVVNKITKRTVKTYIIRRHVTSFQKFWNCQRIFIVNASLMTFKSFIISSFIIILNFSLRSKSFIWYHSFVWRSLMSESFFHWEFFTFILKQALSTEESWLRLATSRCALTWFIVFSFAILWIY